MANSVVVIEKAKPLDYLTDFVVLPRSFGMPEYDAREDVTAIRAAVVCHAPGVAMPIMSLFYSLPFVGAAAASSACPRLPVTYSLRECGKH